MFARDKMFRKHCINLVRNGNAIYIKLDYFQEDIISRCYNREETPLLRKIYILILHVLRSSKDPLPILSISHIIHRKIYEKKDKHATALISRVAGKTDRPHTYNANGQGHPSQNNFALVRIIHDFYTL